MPAYSFVVRREDNSEVPESVDLQKDREAVKNRPDRSGLPMRLAVSPGQDCTSRVRLDRMHDLEQPGRYTLIVHRRVSALCAGLSQDLPFW